MTVLVDTSVWSLALRKRALTDEQQRYVAELRQLVADLRVAMIGPIRQELLSGIAEESTFALLRDRLQPFDDLPITTHDFETAAEFFNRCRARGIQGSHTDFLICAVASNRRLSILTTDKDFLSYASILEILLHQIRAGPQ